MNVILLKAFLKINKNHIISFLTLSCLFLILITITQIYAQKKKLIPTLQNRDENRIIYVFNVKNSDNLNILLKDEKIENILYYMESINIYHNKLGNAVVVTRLPNESLNIKSSRPIDNAKNEIIVSEELYKKLSNKILESDITLSIKNKNIKCKILGYYK